MRLRCTAAVYDSRRNAKVLYREYIPRIECVATFNLYGRWVYCICPRGFLKGISRGGLLHNGLVFEIASRRSSLTGEYLLLHPPVSNERLTLGTYNFDGNWSVEIE